MNTYEKVPVGATHYYYNAAGFGFYSLIRDTWRFWSPCGSCWKFVLDNKPAFEAFPIPQTNIETPEEKEVEWVNGLPPVGVECEAVFIEHEHKGYGEFLILGYYGDYVWMEYIGDLSNNSKHYTAKVDMVKFRKPESEASLCSAESPQQLEEFEWNNGDKCIYEGNLYDYQCVSSWDKSACVLSGASPESKPFTDAWIDELSKPESEAEKLQRERIENGKAYYELISSIESELMCPEHHGYPNMWGELRSEWQEVYIRQAEVLGFSKDK